MEVIFTIFIALMFIIVGSVFYLVIWKGRKITQCMIQNELESGKTLHFKASVGGMIDGIQYKGPLLIFAVFDDFFILKDKKFLFSEITLISQSRISGVKIDIHSGKVVKIYHQGSFLKFFPENINDK